MEVGSAAGRVGAGGGWGGGVRGSRNSGRAPAPSRVGAAGEGLCVGPAGAGLDQGADGQGGEMVEATVGLPRD